MNALRLFAAGVFSAMGLIGAFACAYAGIRLLIDLQSYWRLGWNFDFPPPHFAADRGFGMESWTDNRYRLLFGWPWKIIIYGFSAVTMMRLARRILTTPPTAGPLPLRRRPALWLAACAVCLSAVLLARLWHR